LRSPRNLARKQIDLTGSRIKRPLQLDIEAPLLRPSAVIGTIETFLDESIDIGGSVFPRTLT
jgi:hypothetical protein